MTDTLTLIEDTKRQIRAEFIATHRVIPLRPDLTAQERGRMALESLATALDTLQMVGDFLPANAYETLRDVEIKLSLLCPRLKLKRSLIHLTSAFGRAP